MRLSRLTLYVCQADEVAVILGLAVRVRQSSRVMSVEGPVAATVESVPHDPAAAGGREKLRTT